MKKQILLSGIQPSGNLHIGNYLGAIKQWVELQKSYHGFIAIVDLHAITVPQEPKTLHENTLTSAALLLACGIDPEKTALFIQSHVPAHAELGWILNTLTPVGELERMTQFKEKKERAGTLAGLLNYPTLQAADILLYHPDVVPVGEEQLQHLELTRTLARRFNNRFGNTFKEPRALIQKDASRIMALDDPTKKMSKSSANPNSCIALIDSPDTIRKKIKIAVTDSGKEIRFDPAAKPAVSNLITIYGAFSGLSHKDVEKKFLHKGYAEFKQDLGELLVMALAPIQKKYQKFAQNEKMTYRMLASGAKRAAAVANTTLNVAKKKMGFVL